MKKLSLILCVLILIIFCTAGKVNINYRQKVDMLETKVTLLEIRINEIEAILKPKRLIVNGEMEKLIEYCKKENLNFRESIDVNEMGYVEKAKISTIINKDNMIVQIKRIKNVIQIPNAPGVIPYYYTRIIYEYDYDVEFCIRGENTENYVDGQEIELNKVFKITGTDRFYNKKNLVLSPLKELNIDEGRIK